MQYEIDYIPVGTGEKGGDAIAIRYGDFSDPSKQNVIVIDGGTKDSGKKLVEHIKTYYNTSFVDVVIASHLHSDHISGLTEVVENLNVGKLVVHSPWNHTSSIKKMTKTASTLDKLQTKLEKSVSGLSDLVDVAIKNGVSVISPFQGEHIIQNELIVLGPQKEYYQELLANFGITPEVKDEHKISGILSFGKSIVNWITETLHIETLSDDYPDTDSENNSSLILLLILSMGDGTIKRFLFTGDAGKGALSKVIEYCDSQNYSLEGIDFFDVPHHGSKRNLGPTFLNKIKPKIAYISCPPYGDPKHPSRKVVNALIRRGCVVHKNNQGNIICHHSQNVPVRDGWNSILPAVFHDEVEE